MHSTQNSLQADWDQHRIALKTLYREVAKRVHPDLTLDDADRSRRQRLMADANQAFAYGDANWLKNILEESARPRPAQGAPVPDLVQAVRRITLRARLHLTFIDRFNSEGMKTDRAQLAENLLISAPHSKMEQSVMHFFEQMQLFIRDGYLDEEITWCSFGSSVVRWWAVSKDYVCGERDRSGDDTLFGGFQTLAGWVSERDTQSGFQPPTLADLMVFLEDERKLTMI
jgi:hypothetical protein